MSTAATTITLPLPLVQAAVRDLRHGWEYATDALADHLATWGTSAVRNRLIADGMRRDIDRLAETLDELDSQLPEEASNESI